MALDSKNLWVIHGKRYDLHGFVDQHPGAHALPRAFPTIQPLLTRCHWNA
jgi:hypothetical protein